MSDLKAIKRKLLDENKVDKILEAIQCDYVSYSGGRIEAQLPERFNSSNKRAVQIKLNEYLSASIRNKSDFKNGDLYSLVSYIHHDKRGEDIQKDLHEAKKFICETLGWTEFLAGGNYVTKKDYVAPLKAILKGRRNRVEIKPNPVIPEMVLNNFMQFPSYDWVQEGISYKTQKMYGVGFDLESKRITIPMRNRFGNLVGVKGRILKDDDDDKKYMYLYKFQNRYEWFNLHFALPYIISEKRVYIFEAEKSCMKAFENGIFNTLAIGASEVALEQALIIKQLGLDIEIVFCYDKGISLNEIQETASLFEGRKIFALYDIDDLLGKKNSPIDDGIDIWNRLVEYYKFEIIPKKVV